MHLLVNHLPIVGFAVGVLLLIATMIFRGDRGLFLALLIVIVMSGACGLAAQFTGEPAEEIVEGLPDVPESLVGAHEDAGKIATIIAFGLIEITMISVARESSCLDGAGV